MSGADCVHLPAHARQWLACAFRRFASLFFAHDLVRKPDTTFRDHAFAGGESFRGVVVKQNSGAKARRENDFCCLQKDIQGGFIVSIWKAFRP
jgi:hypothetical protein